jgi:hypothetical protein
MLTLLGTIFGLLGSLLPEILKFWNNKEDHKHEIEMGKLQMEAAKLQGQIKLEELGAQADIAETEAIYKASEQKITGVRWIDGIVSLYNSSVRPTITYGFMVLYMYVKYSLIYSLVQAGAKWNEVGTQIWNSEDFAVLSTILAFWFGARFMRYSLGRTSMPSSSVISALKNGIKK